MSIYSERLDKIKSVIDEPMTIEEITQKSGIGERQVRDVIGRAVTRGNLVKVGKSGPYSLYDLSTSLPRPKKNLVKPYQAEFKPSQRNLNDFYGHRDLAMLVR